MLACVLEPVIQFRKLTVVKVSRRDDDAIDVAASLIEGLVSQRAPQVNANEIPSEYGGEVRGHLLKKVGQILRDVFWQAHLLRQDISSSRLVTRLINGLAGEVFYRRTDWTLPPCADRRIECRNV